MRRFRCDRCGSELRFDASRCGTCGVETAYVPEQLGVRSLRPAGPAAHLVDGDPRPRWRCLNASWGCNWVLVAGTADVWCRSCRLTRGRPDRADPDAVEAWAVAEAEKRRLVHQLDELGLPIVPRTPATPDGLAFDLVHVPGEPQVTGHLDGVVTLDLTEVDDGRRETVRRMFGERFRTVLGHLRHEVGHHYWRRLVVETGGIDRFRELFGDERVDYRAAIEAHHGPGGPEWDPARHLTAYAASHPLEDWAETFAHHLHVVDAAGTAEAHGLAVQGAPARPGFAGLLERWVAVAGAVDAVAASLGAGALYPFTPTGIVIDKLVEVHERIELVAGRAAGGGP